MEPSPSPLALQQLYGLAKSSPDFYNQLYNILNTEEYVQCVPGLQDDGVMQLIDYLDKVCRRVALQLQLPGPPTPRSCHRRLPMVSILPATLRGSVCAN